MHFLYQLTTLQPEESNKFILSFAFIKLYRFSDRILTNPCIFHAGF